MERVTMDTEYRTSRSNHLRIIDCSRVNQISLEGEEYCHFENCEDLTSTMRELYKTRAKRSVNISIKDLNK